MRDIISNKSKLGLKEFPLKHKKQRILSFWLIKREIGLDSLICCCEDFICIET